MLVTLLGLRTRHEHAALFESGDYLPLEAGGQHREHICALARRRRDRWIAVVVPRCVLRIARHRAAGLPRVSWGDTSIPLPRDAPRVWRSVFPDTVVNAIRPDRGPPRLRLAELLCPFPIALCVGLMADNRRSPKPKRGT